MKQSRMLIALERDSVAKLPRKLCSRLLLAARMSHNESTPARNYGSGNPPNPASRENSIFTKQTHFRGLQIDKLPDKVRLFRGRGQSSHAQI
jgi:hypothetical protein